MYTSPKTSKDLQIFSEAVVEYRFCTGGFGPFASMAGQPSAFNAAAQAGGGFGAAAQQGGGFGGFGGGSGFGALGGAASSPAAAPGNSDMWQMRK